MLGVKGKLLVKTSSLYRMEREWNSVAIDITLRVSVIPCEIKIIDEMSYI